MQPPPGGPAFVQKRDFVRVAQQITSRELSEARPGCRHQDPTPVIIEGWNLKMFLHVQILQTAARSKTASTKRQAGIRGQETQIVCPETRPQLTDINWVGRQNWRRRNFGVVFEGSL